MRSDVTVKIFYNARVYAKFSPLKVTDSIVTMNDRIEFCGPAERAMELYGKSATSLVDLGGKTVIPGFVDSHIHLDDLGDSLVYLDLRGTASIGELKERLKGYRKKKEGARVLIGKGWDQESFSEHRWPNRYDLDEAVGDIPVYLERFCEHAAVVNSRMLEIAGRNDFPDYVFPRLGDGLASGIVKEDASTFFKERSIQLAGGQEQNLSTAFQHLLSLGVTSVGFVSSTVSSIEHIGNFPSEVGLRVSAYLRDVYSDQLLEMRKEFSGSSFLKINGIKLFADGALGAQTAALREPYQDDDNNYGMLSFDSDRLLKIFERFKGKDVQFSIHAIGDRGIDEVIKAVSKFGRENLLEPRIEHCTVLREDHLAPLRELKIGISVQPAFVIDDWWAVNRLGRERSRLAYPLATLLRNGIAVGISTDSPVASPNPWVSIDAAVKRGEDEGREIFKYSKDERTDLATALSLYTEGSASLLMNNEIGSLEPGKFADFALLNADPFETSDLRSIFVLETVVGGITRFRRE